MPNHVPGIIVIRPDDAVEARRVASLRTDFGPPQPGSLSKIIQSYKAAVTPWSRQNGKSGFSWQARFYDRIIRDEVALGRIREYITTNPARCVLDRDNPQELRM